MKRTLAAAILLASGLALNAVAQTPAAAPATPAPVPAAVPAKVAVIAFQAVVAQTNEFQRNLADLQRKFEPKRTQIKTMGDDIDNLKKQLQAQGDKLSPTESASRTKAIDDKTKQAQRLMEDAQNDYQTEMQQTFGTVAQKVFEVASSYAQDKGFTLMLDESQSQQQAPVILWAAPTTDISAAIIEAYNVKSGVPAPPPQTGQSSVPKAPTPAVKKPAAPASTAPKQ